MTRCVPHAGRRPHRPRAAARLQLRRQALHRAVTAIRWPRRCWPMACIWSAARSSITGRAASCRPASEEPNALVTIDRGAGRVTPNLRATQIELYDGLRARSQNRCPSLAFDIGAVSNALAPLFPAGFYYKTFMWPRAFWRHVYEPAIRAAAGLGTSADRAGSRSLSASVRALRRAGDRRRPAGLAAALAASAGGARVILCDEQAELGGSLLAETEAAIDGQSAAAWLRETLATLAPARRCDAAAAHHGVRLVPGQSDRPGGAGHRSSGRHPIRACRANGCGRCGRGRVVIATGAIERPLVFSDNDRPGIMLADAARIYLRRYGVQAGRRAVIATRTTVPMRPASRCATQVSPSLRSPIFAPKPATRRAHPGCRYAWVRALSPPAAVAGSVA